MRAESSRVEQLETEAKGVLQVSPMQQTDERWMLRGRHVYGSRSIFVLGWSPKPFFYNNLLYPLDLIDGACYPYIFLRKYYKTEKLSERDKCTIY